MSLSWIQSLRLAAVLEDCSDQLDILGHTLTLKGCLDRGGAAAQETTRLIKLQTDCQIISQQVCRLQLELQEKQSFSSLLQVVEEEEKRKEAEKMRRQQRRELEQRQKTLREQKDELRLKSEELRALSQLVIDLKLQLHVQSSKVATKKKLEEKRIGQQLQQEQKEIIQAEELQEDQLEFLQKQLTEESRVHEESKKYLQDRHKELQQQLQKVQQHTNQMLQEKEQQLNSVSCKKTVNLDKLMEMRRKFREMEQVVMEDREEQEKLRQQQVEIRAATKLQAWWRGCIVRRGLGGFKTEERKKGKKKKEGKKKKT